jgi:hypothetical protein
VSVKTLGAYPYKDIATAGNMGLAGFVKMGFLVKAIAFACPGAIRHDFSYLGLRVWDWLSRDHKLTIHRAYEVCK